MIHSLFLVNASGDIFLEKHWKSVVSRSVCDYFFEAQERATEPENVPPVIPTPHHYLISVLRHRIYFVAVIQSEVPPLFVIEFLHRVVDTFQVLASLHFFSPLLAEFKWLLSDFKYPACVLCSQDYFGVCTEAAIKDNVVVVYELLEEMLDNGFPLATESNILKELIKPPTILRTMVNTITGRVCIHVNHRTQCLWNSNWTGHSMLRILWQIIVLVDKVYMWGAGKISPRNWFKT